MSRQLISPKRLNIKLIEELRFYWADSHSAALATAYLHPQKKQDCLKFAACCRKQYEELGYQLLAAKHYHANHASKTH